MSFVGLPLRFKSPEDAVDAAEWQLLCGLRVACPGIVQSFNATRQTVKVQLAIRENILQDLVVTPTAIKPIVDVPVLLLGGNGFTVCPPIAKGDECLVIFGDMCIDGWWQSGGIQNQLDRRRHDLSDGFALVGVRSQPRKLPSYSATSLQIRSDDGNTMVEVAPSGVVNVKATTVNIGSSPTKHLVFLEDLETLFNAHVHTDPQGGVTGAPTTTLGSTNGTTNTKAS